MGGAECTEARYFLHLWVTAEQTHTQRNKQGGRQASKQTRKKALDVPDEEAAESRASELQISRAVKQPRWRQATLGIAKHHMRLSAQLRARNGAVGGLDRLRARLAECR
jgi:hypothetical protein